MSFWRSGNSYKVFPAYAGVIPMARINAEYDRRVPRVCGGDPLLWKTKPRYGKCSPRMRG